MIDPRTLILLMLVAASGCQLVTDFDRTLIPDASTSDSGTGNGGAGGSGTGDAGTDAGDGN